MINVTSTITLHCGRDSSGNPFCVLVPRGWEKSRRKKIAAYSPPEGPPKVYDKFVYTNNALSFFSSPEGRVVKNTNGYDYQYAISDHQGNTRVLFSSAPPPAQSVTATFEGDADDNSNVFSNVNPANVVTFVAANHTTVGNKVVRMNQNYSAGPSKSLKVYAGDKIDSEVWTYYENNTGFGTSSAGVTAMITAIAGGFGGVSGGVGEIGSIYNGVNSAVNGFGLGGNPGDTQPAAYLNYILFDQSYKVMDMGWTRVPASAYFSKQKMAIPQITVKEAGYIFVYLSYEDQSNNYVEFDDFKVTQTKTNVIQYNEFYNHGSQTVNSWTRPNTTGNNFLANGGTELNATSQLYDLDYRNYDPVLGRMNGVDPMASKYSSLTPYNYSFNNPLSFNDPSGADPNPGEPDFVTRRGLQILGTPCNCNNDFSRTYRGGSQLSIFEHGWGVGSGSLSGGGYGGGVAGSSMSVGEFLSSESGSQFGGTWSGGVGGLFTSSEQALAYGIAYNNYHDSWAYTQFGSEDATKFAYLWASATGEMPLKETVEHHLNVRKQILSPSFIASLNGNTTRPDLLGLLKAQAFLALRMALHIPDAIAVNGNINMVAGFGTDLVYLGKQGGSLLKVLTGPDAGQTMPFWEIPKSVGWDMSVGINFTEFYYMSNSNNDPLRIGDFEGFRFSANAGFGWMGLDVGIGMTYAPLSRDRSYIGVTRFYGVGDSGPSFNINWGDTYFDR